MEEANVMQPGDVFFPASLLWWEHWRKFVSYDGQAHEEPGEGGAQPAHAQAQQSGDEELHPGRMDNTALAAGPGSRELSREVRACCTTSLFDQGGVPVLEKAGEWAFF